jgi:spermidine/putrescine ABC transporter ATP-binding subunit
MSRVLLTGVEKAFGSVIAVQALDLEIREGEFMTLLGPSGCGKTTTLRMIAGFIEPTRGTLLIDDEDVTHVPPQKRGIGMVFQDYALFPHLTIAENIAFGLVERKAPKDKVKARVAELLELIRLPAIAERYPSEISGGQQQRVALARAVAHPPRVLLMDEPLGALDLKLREAMQIELRRIQQELKITTVYVTHDQHEAMTMSDRIAVMNGGRLEQLDAPATIYQAPATRFVADFVGKINFLVGRVVETGAHGFIDTPHGRLGLGPLDSAMAGRQATIAIRPENMRFLDDATPSGNLNMVSGQIETRTFVGNLIHISVRLDDQTRVLVECRPDDHAPPLNSRARITWQPERAIVVRDQ